MWFIITYPKDSCFVWSNCIKSSNVKKLEEKVCYYRHVKLYSSQATNLSQEHPNQAQKHEQLQ